MKPFRSKLAGLCLLTALITGVGQHHSALAQEGTENNPWSLVTSDRWDISLIREGGGIVSNHLLHVFPSVSESREAATITAWLNDPMFKTDGAGHLIVATAYPYTGRSLSQDRFVPDGTGIILVDSESLAQRQGLLWLSLRFVSQDEGATWKPALTRVSCSRDDKGCVRTPVEGGLLAWTVQKSGEPTAALVHGVSGVRPRNSYALMTPALSIQVTLKFP